MSGPGSKSRVNSQLASRVQNGMRTRLEDQALLSRVHSTFLQQGSLESTQKLRRVETLLLDASEDNARWQLLHNDVEQYEVISQKMQTTPSGRTIAIVEYYELGDGLPLAKTLYQLRGIGEDTE